MDMYEEHVMDHYRHPRNAGKLDDAGIVFKDTNPLCGDIISVYLKHDNKGKIVAAKHFSQGCAISQAATSMLFERLEGMSMKQALAIDKQEVLDEFGTTLSVSRIKCALLGLTALKKALVEHAKTHA